MVFNSLQFLIYFITVVLLYFIINYKGRWILLLLSSYYFYMCWRVDYVVLLAASTIITYLTGLKMGEIPQQKGRLKYLVLSLVLNLGLLFTFKYFNFINNSIISVFDSFNILYGAPELKVLLPVGISFYTFQALSYSIDVYRGEKEPERHIGIYALYVSFFPQLVAGPIERSTNLLPQFHNRNDFDYDRVTGGLRLMAWGFFKKVVVADRLAVIVNRVYANPREYDGIPLLIATFLFAYQIYCDFSGYSDIAIGASRVLGYDLTTNFNRPYFSKSIAEFWRRWHISLSTWFRDYLYIPLGGNRVNRFSYYRNILIVFLICGLWHGANWTFVFWGALHSFYFLFSIWTKNVRKVITDFFHSTRLSLIHNFFKVSTTFIFVCFAWIFFRSENLNDAFYIVTHLFSGTGKFLTNITDTGYMRNILGQLGVVQKELIMAIFSIVILESVQLFQEYSGTKRTFVEQPILARWAIYYALVGMILFFGAFNTAQEFIYFQF